MLASCTVWPESDTFFTPFYHVTTRCKVGTRAKTGRARSTAAPLPGTSTAPLPGQRWAALVSGTPGTQTWAQKTLGTQNSAQKTLGTPRLDQGTPGSTLGARRTVGSLAQARETVLSLGQAFTGIHCRFHKIFEKLSSGPFLPFPPFMLHYSTRRHLGCPEFISAAENRDLLKSYLERCRFWNHTVKLQKT